MIDPTGQPNLSDSDGLMIIDWADVSQRNLVWWPAPQEGCKVLLPRICSYPFLCLHAPLGLIMFISCKWNKDDPNLSRHLSIITLMRLLSDLGRQLTSVKLHWPYSDVPRSTRLARSKDTVLPFHPGARSTRLYFQKDRASSRDLPEPQTAVFPGFSSLNQTYLLRLLHLSHTRTIHASIQACSYSSSIVHSASLTLIRKVKHLEISILQVLNTNIFGRHSLVLYYTGN